MCQAVHTLPVEEGKVPCNLQQNFNPQIGLVGVPGSKSFTHLMGSQTENKFGRFQEE